MYVLMFLFLFLFRCCDHILWLMYIVLTHVLISYILLVLYVVNYITSERVTTTLCQGLEKIMESPLLFHFLLIIWRWSHPSIPHHSIYPYLRKFYCISPNSPIFFALLPCPHPTPHSYILYLHFLLPEPLYLLSPPRQLYSSIPDLWPRASLLHLRQWKQAVITLYSY